MLSKCIVLAATILINQSELLQQNSTVHQTSPEIKVTLWPNTSKI